MIAASGFTQVSVPEETLCMTVEEYLDFEERSHIRHEFLDGRIFAMTGASLRHNAISDNLHSIFKNHLAGSKCRSFLLDVKVRIESSNSFYYPDVVVSCTPSDMSVTSIENPVLIVEVLSPATASIDRREKVMAYSQIDSLEEYIIVHQSIRRIDILRKVGGRFSAPQIFESGSFTLASMSSGPLTVLIDRVYENIEWGESNSDDTLLVKEFAEQYTW